MDTFEKTSRTKITRLPKRGSYDKAIVHQILDEAMYGTVAYVRDDEPFQIPTGFCRMNDKIYLHGSVGSYYMRDWAARKPLLCFSATLMDGIVLARSAFHHSVNYRSVVLFGHPETVTGAEAHQAMAMFTNKMQPGRWDDIRQPTANEWKETLVFSLPIEEVSAKVRTGGPKDDEEDYTLDVWAGVIPLKTQRLPPVPDDRLKPGVELPDYLST